jgi:hypothetical protein
MNRFFIAALAFILVGTALRNQIGDGVLSIAIGVGVAFTIVGLFQTYGRKT